MNALLRIGARDRIALLDLATAEVRQSPACGRPVDNRCPATCDRCADAIITRADLLAQPLLEQQDTAA